MYHLRRIGGQLAMTEPSPHGKHTISDVVSWMEASLKCLAAPKLHQLRKRQAW